MKVTMIMALSADGFIAKRPDHFVNWTEIEDKDFFEEKTKEIGTVIMGNNTFKTLSGPLSNRLNIVLSSSADPVNNIPESLEYFTGDVQELLDSLAKRDITEVALIGGGQANASFLVENLVDEIFLTIHPALFGQGMSLSSDYDLEAKLELLDARQIGEGSVLLHYNVLNKTIWTEEN